MLETSIEKFGIHKEKKGKAEGKAEGIRESIARVIKVRFKAKELPKGIVDALTKVSALEQLDWLLEQAALVNSLLEFEKCLSK